MPLLILCCLYDTLIQYSLRGHCSGGLPQLERNTHPLCFETMKAVCLHSATNNSSVNALFCTVFFSVMLYLLQGCV